MNEYKNLKVSDLRDIAKSRGLRGWTRLRKTNLISFIIDNEDFTSDRATENAREMGNKAVKELRAIAQAYNIRVRSRANKSEIIYLLGENYGERRRAAYERDVGLWDSEIRASEETARWSQEIGEEERSRQPSEPARPRLTRRAMNGTVQKWFVDGSEYLDPDVFLHDIADGVKRMVDSFNWPKKVYMNLSCVLEKEDPKTGVSKFKFEVKLTDEGDIGSYETYFKLTEKDSFDITSDTFLNNKKWTKYLTSNKKKEKDDDKGFGVPYNRMTSTMRQRQAWI